MEKQKIKRINITLPSDLHEKAKKESIKIFGKPNVSGLIAILISKHIKS